MNGASAELTPVQAAADDTPTLDKLHQAGVINPSTMDKDADGNPIAGTGVVYPESAYTYTRVAAKGENTVTKFEWDAETGTMTPVYYRIDLKKTEYGTGENAKYYKWTTDEDGTRRLVETTEASEAEITAKYDSTNPQTRLENTTDNASLNIVGSYINNNITLTSTTGSVTAYGGAINNSGTIGDITGDFIGNYASATANSDSEAYAYGGAIYNCGTIGNITGDFVDNYVQSQGNFRSTSFGGAISNNADTQDATATIGDITGNFIANNGSNGGAIFNRAFAQNATATIGDITGNFIANNGSNGGAISNSAAYSNATAAIGNITGDFIANYGSNGGAISNSLSSYVGTTATISNITGNFIGNYAVFGGAIYNDYRSTIGDITGDFIGNYVYDFYTGSTGSASAYGGAIYNKGTIGNITGDFIGNYASSDSVYSNTPTYTNNLGGAIYSYEGIIGNITGDFVNNYVSQSAYDDSEWSAAGGAIYIEDTMVGDIKGDFTGNYVESRDGVTVGGGAIINYVIYGFEEDSATGIGNITGDFTNNYVSSSGHSYQNFGGAILNYGHGHYYGFIGDIVGNFVGNHVSGSDDSGAISSGGAIYNNITIGNISGDFTGNYVEAWAWSKSGSAEAEGGAIANILGTIGDINGDFTANYAYSYRGSGYGGAILNIGTSDDANPYHHTPYGIGNITANFTGNYVNSDSSSLGGAIYNLGTIGDITGDFTGNYVYSSTYSSSEYARGGAISNSAYNGVTGTIGSKDSDGNVVGGIINSNFTDNYVKMAYNYTKPHGGAIYTYSSLNIIADNGTSNFSGNYVQIGSGEKDYEAVYVDSKSADLSLIARNNGVITFDDKINGVDGYNLKLTGDGSGVVSLYNSLGESVANVSADNVIVNFANNEIYDYKLKSLNSADSAKYAIDVDLTNEAADTISVSGTTSTGLVTLSKINLVGSTLSDVITVQVLKVENDALQLALDDNSTIVSNILDSLTDTVYADEIYAQKEGIALSTTDTTNDSITILKDKIYDTLDLINSKESANERNFIFRTSDNYNLSTDLSATTEGTLNIVGLSEETPSTLDANGHKLFELSNKTTLNISNTVITNAQNTGNGGAVNITNADAVLNVVNSKFENNNVSATSDTGSVSVHGGAISNDGTIENITGDFIGNYAEATSTIEDYRYTSYAFGGAIYNSGTIGSKDADGNVVGSIINSNFKDNYAKAESEYGEVKAQGGAIYNKGTITVLDADFEGNNASASTPVSSSSNAYAYGGAISNENTIGNITGNFSGNYASAVTAVSNNAGSAFAHGGAIYNNGTIGDISGDFSGNYAYSSGSKYVPGGGDSGSPAGGAIYNEGTLGNVTGNFIGNYALGTSDLYDANAFGGAIYNKGTIGNITGDFTGNNATAASDGYSTYVYGGAIFNEGMLASVTGNFIDNYASATPDSLYADAYGGAISNRGTIGDITGDFSGNYASAYTTSKRGDTSVYAYGGAIYNHGTIGSKDADGNVVGGIINSSFKNNYVSATSDSSAAKAYGGAIYNDHTIGDITGDFSSNYTSAVLNSGPDYAEGGAIYNSIYGTIDDITADFTGNYTSSISYSYGGAIYNWGTIGDISGDFSGNYASSSYSTEGGAIFNSGTIGDITGDFTGNYATSKSYAFGGAIYNYGTIGDITGDFTGNYTSAVSNSGSAYAYGGAIYNYGTIGSKDSDGNVVGGIINSNFTDNYAKVTSESGEARAHGGAICTSHSLNIIADNGTSNFSGNYVQIGSGEKDYEAVYVDSNSADLSLIARNNGTITFDDKINGVDGYNLKLTGDGTGVVSLYNSLGESVANVSADNVTVNLVNNEIYDYKLKNLTSEDSAKYAIDVDLTNKTADTVAVQSSGAKGLVTLTGLNFMGANSSEVIKIQVLKVTNSNLQLALGDNFHVVDDVLANLTDTVYANDIYAQEDGIALSTTDTTNDSISILKDKIYDTLDLINSKESANERNFIFKTSDSYNLSTDLSATTAGTLNIVGLSEETPSILDANGHKLFELSNKTTLNISNTVITNAQNTGNGGAVNITNADAVLNVVNSKFENNTSKYGGAIYNSGKITVLDADFESNNAAASDRVYVYGGAISNDGTIENITGDFTENYASSVLNSGSTYAYGGAIYNNGTIGSKDANGNVVGGIINSSFKNNYVSATSDSSAAKAFGGVIYNGATIGDITGDFIGNYASATANSDSEAKAYGGAISNHGTIGDITGDFSSNYTSAVSNSGPDYAYGGAISNHGTIGDITADFAGNYTSSISFSDGGAIYNDGTIGDIAGDFSGNYASSSYSTEGGAIFNSGTIGDITGDFTGNNTTATSDGSNPYAYGGAIYNGGTIGDITGDFINNYSVVGGAIYNGGAIGDITGDFSGNHSKHYGGAINNGGEIGSKDSDGNVVGGIINSNFTGNYASSSAGYAYGGAISNNSTIHGIINSNFTDNYAKATSESGEAYAYGGAIYTTADLNIIAKDGYQSLFSGNYTEINGVKDDNAVYVGSSSATLNFKLQTGGSVLMKDNIDGAVDKDDDGNITEAYDVNIEGDDINKTAFYMQNQIRNADLTIGNTTINMINNQTQVNHFNSLKLSADTNFVADVDLANAEMDRFTAEYYATHSGNLNVTGMNLLSDMPKGVDSEDIYFAQVGLKDNVVNKVNELPTSYQTTLYTPIYKYNAVYDNRNDGGYFIFARGDKVIQPQGGGTPQITPTGNPSDAFNPSVLAPSVAAQAGAMSTVGQTFNYAFQNADNFMNIPYLERVSIKLKNRYALSPTGDATDVGTFSPLFTRTDEASVWVKPYASFENVPLRNGPKVSNITYGTLVGYDTKLIPMKHGWDRVWTGYIGYNGASQRYNGVDATQNGGLLGGTLTLYKGNFFNATTVSAGASVGNNSTMYGHEDFALLLAGIANKTGYNYEFKEGRIIIQPNMLISYTFVNTFDYTNAAGVRMKSDPLNAIQLAPGVKIIGNLPNGWQPYIGVNMIWNLLDKSRVTADDVRLPEMSIKPYVQYGVGVQKRVKDNFMAFGQAMIQNGGRNGISLTAGFRWSVGKEGKPLEKVSNPQQKIAAKPMPEQTISVTSRLSAKSKTSAVTQSSAKKIIKQMTMEQKISKGLVKPQKTTRTTNSGILKQL